MVSDDSMKTAKQVSAAFVRRFPRFEYNEVLSEAYIIMTDAIATWEPDKGRALQSWIAFMIHRNLKKIFFKDPIMMVTDMDEFVNTELNPEQIYLEYEKQHSLSKLSRDILRMVYNGEVPATKDNKNSIKGAIKTQLRKQGVAFNKIKSAFHELKMAAISR